MREVMGVFGIEYPKEGKNKDMMARNVINRGKKNPVSARVHKALDSFFEPYNKRLAKLLNNDKWLWKDK